jgi:hypothetical protein
MLRVLGGASEGTVAGLDVKCRLAGTQQRQARGNRLEGTADRGTLHVVVMLLVLVQFEAVDKEVNNKKYWARIHGANRERRLEVKLRST